MKRLTRPLLLSVCLALVGPAQAQPAVDPSGVEEPELRRELLRMEEKDQEARLALFEKSTSGAQITQEDVAAVQSVDRAHTQRMKVILEEYGWPGEGLVGADGANAAFLLVQHADLDPAFQREALALLRAAYRQEEATGSQLALLTDRVLVAEGKPQRYGTQASIQGGAIIIHPIEDSLHVDERRAEMGLEPLEDYEQGLREMYLPPAGDDPDEQ